MKKDEVFDKIISDEGITFEETLTIEQEYSLDDLLGLAERVRREKCDNTFSLCSIINVKSGKCSENCRFCAQSSHWDVVVDEYDCIDEQVALEQAVNSCSSGVKRLSLVSAGRGVDRVQIEKYAKIYEAIKKDTKLKLCASMGMLNDETAAQLRAVGVERYHCNLETSRSFFPHICSTHTWDEKVATIKTARKAGMDICSGGIIGLGESMQQRIELAHELKNLSVRSIPINILTPIPGTPAGDIAVPEIKEILKSIALFRLVNPGAVVRAAGGRNQFGADQHLFFQTGINGAIVGNFLTTAGNGIEDDLCAIKNRGFDVKR